MTEYERPFSVQRRCAAYWVVDARDRIMEGGFDSRASAYDALDRYGYPPEFEQEISGWLADD